MGPAIPTSLEFDTNWRARCGSTTAPRLALATCRKLTRSLESSSRNTASGYPITGDMSLSRNFHQNNSAESRGFRSPEGEGDTVEKADSEGMVERERPNQNPATANAANMAGSNIVCIRFHRFSAPRFLSRDRGLAVWS